MIEIYLPFFIFILLTVAGIFFLFGYIVCAGFENGERVDANIYENLMEIEIDRRKIAEKELALEIEHSRQLEKVTEKEIK